MTQATLFPTAASPQYSFWEWYGFDDDDEEDGIKQFRDGCEFRNGWMSLPEHRHRTLWSLRPLIRRSRLIGEDSVLVVRDDLPTVGSFERMTERMLRR